MATPYVELPFRRFRRNEQNSPGWAATGINFDELSDSSEDPDLPPLRERKGFFNWRCIDVHVLEDFGVPSDRSRQNFEDTVFIAGLQTARSLVKRKRAHSPDIEFWPGANQPWFDGEHNRPITDGAAIAREERRKRAIEAEDFPSSAAVPTAEHVERLHGLGINVGFLLFLTWECKLWQWKTWEVVRYLVKPATEPHGRCRFAELPWVHRFTRPATVYASHSWNGRWGDLVCAVCAGADHARFVWIDVFAVRQWPGNGADLHFRPVVQRCVATIVVVAPPATGMLAEERFNLGANGAVVQDYGVIGKFLFGKDYKKALKTVPFFRVWCLIEMFYAVEARKPLLLRWDTYNGVDRGHPGAPRRRVDLYGEMGCRERAAGRWQALKVMENCRAALNLESAQTTMESDKNREVEKVREFCQDIGGVNYFHETLQREIRASMIAAEYDIAEVDNFVCAEVHSVRADMVKHDVSSAVCIACVLGDKWLLWELLSMGVSGGGDFSSRGTDDDGAATADDNDNNNDDDDDEIQTLRIEDDDEIHTVLKEDLDDLDSIETQRDDDFTTVAWLDCLSPGSGVKCARVLEIHFEWRTLQDVNDFLRAHAEGPAAAAQEALETLRISEALSRKELKVVKAGLSNASKDILAAAEEEEYEDDDDDDDEEEEEEEEEEREPPAALSEEEEQEEEAEETEGDGDDASEVSHDAPEDGGFFGSPAERAEEAMRTVVESHLPLTLAAEFGREEVVELLLCVEGVDPNRDGRDGAFPLLLACQNCHHGVVERLLAHREIDVNKARIIDGSTPLSMACQAKRADSEHVTDVVETLLGHEDIDVNKATREGCTPLFVTCQEGRTGVVTQLLSHPTIDVNQARTSDGATPLYAASDGGHEEVARRLLAHPAIDVNQAKRSDGATALLAACQRGDERMVRLLLAHGASVAQCACAPAAAAWCAWSVQPSRGCDAPCLRLCAVLPACCGALCRPGARKRREVLPDPDGGQPVEGESEGESEGEGEGEARGGDAPTGAPVVVAQPASPEAVETRGAGGL